MNSPVPFPTVGTGRKTPAGDRERIEWLEVLQGFSMLLVVIGHISLSNIAFNPDYPFTAALERIIYSFHMPLFIFISGWLFQLTCLSSDRHYRSVMKRKLSRLGIPFLVFTVVTIGLKLAFPGLMHRQVDTEELLNTFVLFSSNPLGEMWFLITLLILMAAFPIYRWLDRHSALIWGCCVAVPIALFFPDDIMVFQLSKVMGMLPYFIAGLVCCRYGVIERYASNPIFFTVCGSLFILCNVLQLYPDIIPGRTATIVGSFLGIGLSISVCSFITRLNPATFSSFRRYTFQIFLLGIFFQMAVRYIYGAIGHLSPLLYPLLFIISIIAGLYTPVVIAKIVERYFPRLKLPLGL